MAFEDILARRREIKNGPGAKAFDIGRICDDPHPVSLAIRGLTSNCDCSVDQRCSYCISMDPAWLLIVGTFNPDLHQRHFVFWGFINRDARGDGLRRAPVPADGERVSCHPSRSQLVFGRYTPYGGSGSRGWIAPLECSLDELYAMFRHTDGLERTFDTHSDRLGDGQWIKDGSELTLLPPARLFGLCERREALTLSLWSVENSRNEWGIATIVGMEPLAEEGVTFPIDGRGPRNMPRMEERWMRFRLTLHLGESNVPYTDAWIDVLDDGCWHRIHARTDSGKGIYWVHSSQQSVVR